MVESGIIVFVVVGLWVQAPRADAGFAAGMVGEGGGAGANLGWGFALFDTGDWSGGYSKCH